ncbi:MAG: NB-ARC domain-containing protein [Elainellaceae cyanobacterium]
MASIKASAEGLASIKRAIAQKGWKVGSDRWLVEASKVLEPQGTWHESGPYAYGCSPQTWERFLQGTAIRDRSFIAFCQVLGIQLKDVTASSNQLREDWGDAPDVPNFHGRTQELDRLEQWILADRMRLIAIVGLAGIGKTRLVRGGIGKTDLSLQLARRIRGEFDCLIWRRLINAPPLETLLIDLIEFVSEQQETPVDATLEELTTQLLDYLRQRRCLLILDNVESILQGVPSNQPSGAAISGSYRAGYEGYGALFRRIGETEHKSCLLLTSRIKPKDVETMAGVWSVRSLELGGVDIAAGQAIFQDIGQAQGATFQGSEADWEQLFSFYGGNPLALEVAAKHILRRFGGDLAQFLAQDLRVFGGIRDLLDWHFERFSDAEKDLMYWLAINREAVSIAELKADVLLPIAQKQVPETLDSLERHIPIERSEHRFTLQPVLIEYMTNRFIKTICQELQSGCLNRFNSHALIKASASDYVRESQIRMILRPIIEQIAPALGLDSETGLSDRLAQILAHLRQLYPKRPGYAAGNLLNLMRYSGIDLSHWDFSDLAIWQADLQNINLRQVNFTSCAFARSSFTQDFGGVHAIAFSPRQDTVAMGDSIGGIRLLRLADWQPCLYIRGHGKDTWVTSIAYSPDGSRLASSSMDGTVKLWDVNTGACLQTLTSTTKWVWAVAFSPYGATIASGGNDHEIKLWNIRTGDRQVLKGHSAQIWGIAFHPTVDLLASAAYDGTVRIWDVATGECRQILSGHQSIVLSVSFHPDGNTLVSGSADSTVKIWDTHTGDCLNTLRGHTKEVYSTAFNGDGTLIASGSFDPSAKVWDAQTGQLLKTFTGHFRGVRILAFAPDKNLLATGETAQRLKLWDVDTGVCLKTWRGYTDLIWALAIAPDGRQLASGSLDGTVRLWDIQTGTLVKTLKGHRAWIWAVAFSPDGQTLVSSSDDETVRLWNVGSGQCRATLRGHTEGGVWAAASSPDGQLIASGGRDGTVRLWDAATGKTLQNLAAHSASNWIWGVTFSPDGQTLASCSDDQTIKLWDVKTGDCRLCLTNSGKVMAIAFHPDGHLLLSGGDDQHIQLWDLSAGELIRTFEGHTDSVLGLVFDANRDILISSSIDATIRLWELDTGRCLQVLRGHESTVRSLALTPDGQMLASGSTDNTIRFWEIPTGNMLKLLRPARPYEGMNITDVKGLTAAQKEVLRALGAVEHP